MRATVRRCALKRFLGPFVWASCLAIPAASLATDSDGLLALARAQRESGDLSAAAKAFERLLSTAQSGEAHGAGLAVLHRELGEVYEDLERPRDAAEEFAQSLTADPAQLILRYKVGILYRQLSEPSKAAEHLSEAFQQGFRNTAVRFHLAASQFASGQFASGLENARAMVQTSPQSSDLAVRVGRLLFEYHFYRDALGAFETAFDGATQSPNVRVYLALTSHLLNHHERAVELLQPLSSLGGPANAEVLTLLAAALASLERFDEAGALLERAIAKEPSSPHPYLNLALVLLEQGKAELAGDWFGRMFLAAGSASPKVFYAVQRNSCADAYRELADGSGGESEGANPARGLQLFEFARSLSARHHHGTAIELLRIAARDAGGGELPRSRLHRELGFSCLNLEPGSETAVQLLERGIELDPLDHQALFLLGRAHQRRHRPVEAIRAFERAIELQPEAAPYYTELARAMIASGLAGDQTARASSVLAKAIEIDSSDASARFELAKLEMGRGRLDEAEQHLLKAVDAAPEFFEAYYVLGQVYARARKPAKSRKSMQEFQAKKSAIEARSTIWKDATVRVNAE